MPKLWRNSGEIMANLRRNFGEMMAKLWQNYGEIDKFMEIWGSKCRTVLKSEGHRAPPNVIFSSF